MPYDSIDDLPEDQVDGYSEGQKRAFLSAFNDCEKMPGTEEGECFKRAHGAARRAGRRYKDGAARRADAGTRDDEER